MKMILFHNPYERVSRQLLNVLQQIYPIEIINFMKARDQYWFQGTPCVWIGGDSPEKEAWSKCIDVTVEDVVEALGFIRELHIEGIFEGEVGDTITYTIRSTDFEGTNRALPPNTTITIGEQVLMLEANQVTITFEFPGIYSLHVAGNNAVPVLREVIIHDTKTS